MNGRQVQVSRRTAFVRLLAILSTGALAGAIAAAALGSGSQVAPQFHLTASKPLVNAASLAEGFRPVVNVALPAMTRRLGLLGSPRWPGPAKGKLPAYVVHVIDDGSARRLRCLHE